MKNNQIVSVMQKIKLLLSYAFNYVLLSVVYFIGIGLTSIFSKTFGKKFLETDSLKLNKSKFMVFNKKSNLEKMF